MQLRSLTHTTPFSRPRSAARFFWSPSKIVSNVKETRMSQVVFSWLAMSDYLRHSPKCVESGIIFEDVCSAARTRRHGPWLKNAERNSTIYSRVELFRFWFEDVTKLFSQYNKFITDPRHVELQSHANHQSFQQLQLRHGRVKKSGVRFGDDFVTARFRRSHGTSRFQTVLEMNARKLIERRLTHNSDKHLHRRTCASVLGAGKIELRQVIFRWVWTWITAFGGGKTRAKCHSRKALGFCTNAG